MGAAKTSGIMEDDDLLSPLPMRKTEGLSDDDLGLSTDESPIFSSHSVDFPPTPTDNEVSKYSFFKRLKHYMEGHKITEGIHASVALCIFIEAGAAVCGMDPMKKECKECVYLQSTWLYLMR
jgi:hypothetical protein